MRFDKVPVAAWMKLGSGIGGAINASNAPEPVEQSTQTESSYGAVDLEAPYAGEGGDGPMTNAEAASYGIMQPESQNRQYGLGGQWRDKEYSPAEVKRYNDNATIEYWKTKGEFGAERVKALRDDQLDEDKRDLNDIQRKELDRASSIRDQQQAVMKEDQEARAAAGKGDFSAFKKLVEKEYNNNIPGLDDGRVMKFSDDGFVSVSDPKTGYGQNYPLNKDTVNQALDYRLERRLAAISPEAWQAERKFQTERKDKETDVRLRERAIDVTALSARERADHQRTQDALMTLRLGGYGMQGAGGARGAGIRSSGTGASSNGSEQGGYLGIQGLKTREDWDKFIDSSMGGKEGVPVVLDKDKKPVEGVDRQGYRERFDRIATDLATGGNGLQAGNLAEKAHRMVRDSYSGGNIKQDIDVSKDGEARRVATIDGRMYNLGGKLSDGEAVDYLERSYSGTPEQKVAAIDKFRVDKEYARATSAAKDFAVLDDGGAVVDKNGIKRSKRDIINSMGGGEEGLEAYNNAKDAANTLAELATTRYQKLRATHVDEGRRGGAEKSRSETSDGRGPSLFAKARSFKEGFTFDAVGPERNRKLIEAKVLGGYPLTANEEYLARQLGIQTRRAQ